GGVRGAGRGPAGAWRQRGSRRGGAGREPGAGLPPAVGSSVVFPGRGAQLAVGAGEAVDVDPRIGAAVDKYVIVRPLGRGGMGAVYEARHAHLERRFATKFLLPELAANPEALRRFEN